VGTGPAGDPGRIDFVDGATTALLFLTSSCVACRGFWERLAQDPSLPQGVSVAVTTPGATLENRRKVAELAPAPIEVVMSGEAWADYAVTGSPFAVVVADGAIVAEGPVLSWADLQALVTA
jgi:hypothetical protein